MMYAIVQVSGLQHRVSPGDTIEVNRIPTAVGKPLTLDQVLLAHDGKELRVGQPMLKGAKVICEVAAALRGPKLIAFKFRRRESYRRTIGHRQNLTRLVVKEIKLS